MGKAAPRRLNFPKEKYIIPNSLKEIIKVALRNNPKIISFGLEKQASFSDISLSASDLLLPSLNLSLSAQKSLGS